ncbi:MAG TPA: 3'-5' exonuclease [Candidatus Sulfotelmatobacter sp.]|nr:3'-5' exonuclease [Candidatus Sulfotelmatobacter sp.]HWI58420.1 3'-5' exonuclease [Bacillota bacterium]
MNLVIFDLETTGLSPYANDIIQIAAVRVASGNILSTESFSTYVNPGCSIPAFITSLTGIADSHVRNAPDIASALADFSRFASDDVLLAHNGRRFDVPFIREACSKRQLPTRSVLCSDSISLSKQVWHGSRGHGLDAILDRLGLSTNGIRRHDARGDVELLAKAVLRMWRSLIPDCSSFPGPTFPGILPG